MALGPLLPAGVDAPQRSARSRSPNAPTVPIAASQVVHPPRPRVCPSVRLPGIGSFAKRAVAGGQSTPIVPIGTFLSIDWWTPLDYDAEPRKRECIGGAVPARTEIPFPASASSLARRLSLAFVVLAALFCLAGLRTSVAAADPTYGVMNAEGGIYWRSGPDWNTAVAVSGFGFYPNTIVEIHCYQAGAGNVPGSADYMWEQASDVGGSGYGSGWINEHFINDGQPINQPSPGVPPCQSGGPTPPSTPPPPSQPGGGLVFPIFNAEGGIYYRYGPHWAETTQTPGEGVYDGDQVELICGAFGDAVGPYADTAWSKVRNLSRPVGEGWVNEHFINDGAPDNGFVPGEPMCQPGGAGTGSSSAGGGGSTSTPQPGGSLYYSPYRSSDPGHGREIIQHYGFFDHFERWISEPAPSTFTANYDEWHPGGDSSCPGPGQTVPARIPGGVIAGRMITTLAAWSKARSAPLLFLQSGASWVHQINYIVLFDPGDLNEYESVSCPKSMYQALATWLGESKVHRLAVLAGQVTADNAHPINGHAHAGIQNYLFPAIRNYPNAKGQNIRQQVVVCNYEGMSHEDVWINFKGAMNQAPISPSSCPGWSGHKVEAWNP